MEADDKILAFDFLTAWVYSPIYGEYGAADDLDTYCMYDGIT